MYTKLVYVFLSLVAVDAMAVDANDPPTTKPATSAAQTAPKSIALPRINAPMYAETRATRMPDGSLAIMCADKPNPRARALPQQTRSPQVDPDQHP
jgi:hypothetical protein